MNNLWVKPGNVFVEPTKKVINQPVVLPGKTSALEKEKKLASYSHRTATTAHPCYIPILGDSAGAGRMRLARAAKVGKIPVNKVSAPNLFSQKNYFCHCIKSDVLIIT